ncbi:FecCD family ABC transporter permease [Camelimonas lactis]|uniref:Iron complex transport system permease protein n=1 Tax=Camelimonas lactis TaxID=659006 RepID=A0A4R2GVW7_9HYPH|nr:iron ABC transporter permease [Camelimonas lactis]TCO15120.1 iron complex transport system permease protein [Camelimonas lactis]
MIRHPLPMLPWPWLVAVLLVATVALTLASVAIGYAPLNLGAAIAGAWSGRDSMDALVLVQLRLPRALLGAFMGFSLGVSGAALQGLLRNPLAEPGVIGVSGAAAFGAVCVFYFGFAGAFALALPLGGMVGALVATLLLFRMAGASRSPTGLILAGVAINALAGAFTALALNLSPNPYAALEIVFWLMGSLADRSMAQFLLAAPLMVLGWIALLASARNLEALALGEDTAASLGVNLQRLRLQLVLGSALAVGSAVSVTGAVGFVGLVAPHLMRPLVGHRPGRLLLVSGFAGAMIVLCADMAVRLLPVQPELKLGVMTALVGAPFLISMLQGRRRS